MSIPYSPCRSRGTYLPTYYFFTERWSLRKGDYLDGSIQFQKTLKLENFLQVVIEEEGREKSDSKHKKDFVCMAGLKLEKD